MKSLLAACLIIMITATACTRSSDDIPQSPAAFSGDWIVLHYWDKKDETTDYRGWVLNFLSGGKAKAVNGAQVVQGTWSKSSSRFNLDFGADPLFSAFNDDWLIIDATNSTIWLRDDNPAQDDVLTLSKK
jgi:hypothetical protein